MNPRSVALIQRERVRALKEELNSLKQEIDEQRLST